ncbi:allophanate hydrolase [Rariglobus hedericola]|uniref:Allophanate hydrolase n=1 Tax=Rariglobus hedericola TaxID=2597822 RepID=A0A556QKE2_9BACT|nr:allophanate hydrolase [Rariglobus hedericola]TSJ77087.1 allophanate hydrolase [Rariglobus hedericola]
MSTDTAIWIHRLNTAEQARFTPTASTGPLAGLTFAIKDNIDLVGIPTTAACPGFTYTPSASAHVVQNLLTAGALPVGKTNLDQFATGLVGTRSPHGAPRCVFNSDYISGGSSSGSAVAVASGLVDFALGTDTAGSGRVPAAFNQIIGLKPTKGRLSTRGVVPACRSLDCVSIFARDIATTTRVLAAAEGYDPADPFSRPKPNCHLIGDTSSGKPRLGAPRADQLEWFGNTESPALFATALDRLRALGAEIIEVDFAPFLDAARLLYEGPWTAERYAAVGEFIEQHSATPEAARAAGLDPTVAKIILGGKTASAVDAFRATYRLAELRRAADTILPTVDALVAPTAGTIYTVAEMEADPIRLNSNLGRYNNFMNLLDLCGLTVPAGRYTFGPGFGITFIAPAWQDAQLLVLGARYLGENTQPVCNLISDKPAAPPSPASPSPVASEITLAVCGAHLRGQPLHHQLTTLGARFLAATTTSARYQLYALAHTTPPKPGLVRIASDESGGAPIAVETYALTLEAFGRFTAAVPAPLVIGNAELNDGTWVKSFLCEPHALNGARNISSLGGWLAYLGSPR